MTDNEEIPSSGHEESLTAPRDSASSTPEPSAKAPASTRRSRVERRSRSKNGSGRKWLFALVALVLLVALAVGSYYAYTRIMAQRAASEALDQAITLVERADSTVIEVDEVVRAEIDAELANQAAEALADLPDAVADLEEATSLIDTALPDLQEDRVEEASALEGSAQARLTMLGHAEVVLDANVKASGAIGPANEGWDQVLVGEKTADQAVAEYNKLTTEAVKKSRELTVKASGEITSGKTKLEEAQDIFPEADFRPFIAYAEAKLAALELSVKADDAFTAGNKQEANKLSDQYNDAEKKIVEQAKQLPASPNAVIANAYESMAGTATTEYFDAREAATVADAELMKVSESEE